MLLHQCKASDSDVKIVTKHDIRPDQYEWLIPNSKTVGFSINKTSNYWAWPKLILT